nr:hypothetical protein [Tanacetum cinerariifolium]
MKTKDQLEHHSTGVHKKPNVGHLSTSHCTSTHMYGQGSASNIDKSLIEPSHDVALQLSTMGLTPTINDNDPLGCTHPHVYVDDKANSAATEGFNIGRTKRKELLGITPIRKLFGTWGDKIDGGRHFLWI